MSYDSPRSPREELELRVTAGLLGELSPEETAALQTVVEADPELRHLQGQLRRALALLREATTLREPVALAPMRLSHTRREQLFQHFKGQPSSASAQVVEPAVLPDPEVEKPASPWFWIKAIAALVAVAAVLASLAVPAVTSSMMKGRATRQRADFAMNEKAAADARMEHELAEQTGSGIGDPQPTLSMATSAARDEKYAQLKDVPPAAWTEQGQLYPQTPASPALPAPTTLGKELAGSNLNFGGDASVGGGIALNNGDRETLRTGTFKFRDVAPKNSDTGENANAIAVLPNVSTKPADITVSGTLSANGNLGELSLNNTFTGGTAVVAGTLSSGSGFGGGGGGGSLVLNGSRSLALNGGASSPVGGHSLPAGGKDGKLAPDRAASGPDGLASDRARTASGPVAASAAPLAMRKLAEDIPAPSRPMLAQRDESHRATDNFFSGSDSSRLGLRTWEFNDADADSPSRPRLDYGLAAGQNAAAPNHYYDFGDVQGGEIDPTRRFESRYSEAKPADAGGGNPIFGSLRSGNLAVNQNAVDALLFGVAGTSALAPAAGSFAGVITDPQFQIVTKNGAVDGKGGKKQAAKAEEALEELDAPKDSSKGIRGTRTRDKVVRQGQGAVPSQEAQRAAAPMSSPEPLAGELAKAAPEKSKAGGERSNQLSSSEVNRSELASNTSVGKAKELERETVRRDAKPTKDGEPTDLFLNGYSSFQKAEQLERDGRLPQALQSLQEAAKSLEVITATRPGWNSSIVALRNERVQDALQRVQKKLEAKADPAPAGDAPPTPPAVPPATPQPEVPTAANALSTFSLHVSDVSFKLAAAALDRGTLPDPGSVRSEEFLNAFDYRDPEPATGTPFAFVAERARSPFAQNRDLLRLSVKTGATGRAQGQPLNLVVLLDNSGSMERADRVRIVHESLRVLATQLGPQDKLSVVTFARTPRLWADGISGDQAAAAVERVSEITPQGGTNLEAALELGYQTAHRHIAPGAISRVVLLTDGAANLGEVNAATLEQKVEAERRQGIALDGFGIGWEGYQDDLLEQLTRHGDGRYGFVNSPEEAASGFASQLAGALRVAAADVKVQVEFNPNRVTAYRQVGYAKHQLTAEQFRDNTVDAAEIGAAEAGNALYVVAVNPQGSGDLATVRVRFKVPGTDDYREHAWPVPFTGAAAALDESSPALRLAASASAFSEMLAGNPYAGDVTTDRLLGYLKDVPDFYGADPRLRQLESMLRQVKSLTGK